MDDALPRLVFAYAPGLRVFDDADIARFASVAAILDTQPLGSWDDPRAGRLLAEARVVVAHWGCPVIDAGVLGRAPRLGLIAYAAGTVKGTVAEEVFGRGIRVTSGANANAEPVAEYTLAAILFAAKDVLWRRDVLRDPGIKQQRQRGALASGNWGKTVGIVGASLVGRRVIDLLRPFPHLAVALYDPYVDAREAERLGVRKMELDELCAAADILSIHAPDIAATRRMIGARQLAALRTGATLINTARGRLVDHDALVDELERGRLYAILDVTDPEPLPDDHPLRRLPNVFLTPHLAGSQGAELHRLAEYAADEIRHWSAGEPALNEVTREQLHRLA